MIEGRRSCASCEQNFRVEPEDHLFYEHMTVPPPTWCPECRLIRRLAWRNERLLFKRPSDWDQKMIFAMYPSESPVKVYENSVWWQDSWDNLQSGRSYDFSKSFFNQFQELLKEAPLCAMSIINGVNSDYCNNYNDLKDCYLVFGASTCEKCMYSDRIWNSHSCSDMAFVTKTELCYEGVNLDRCYRTFFSANCESCHEVYFSRNLIGCSCCFGCTNMRNKEYYFLNEPLSKEQYEAKMKSIDLASHQALEEWKQISRDLWAKEPVRFMEGRQNANVSGDYVYHSKNVNHSWNITGGEDLKYCFALDDAPIKNCYDFSIFGVNCEDVYEGITCGHGVSNIKFCNDVWQGVRNLTYCVFCVSNSQHCFGCAGLRNKEYCILNKQYTKEEYGALIPQIIAHMNTMPYVDSKSRAYRYGEFFPTEISPLAYNESVAQDFFPLNKEEAERKGYAWRETENKNYQVTLKTENIPDHLKDVSDSITKEIIECANKSAPEARAKKQCSTAFRITPQEYEFYKNLNLPLPRLCPNCRHSNRMEQRNPLKLEPHSCDCKGKNSKNQNYTNISTHSHGEEECSNKFETAYRLNEPTPIYCADCYQSEIR